MGPFYDSASEAAQDILRRMLERRARRTTPRYVGPGMLQEFTETAIEFDDGREDFLEELYLRFGRPEKRKPVRPYVRIRRFHQSVFAEVFRQALAEGLAVVDAVELAAKVNPSWTLRRALKFMADRLRAGYPLWGSLAASQAWVSPGLLAALDVGEQYGGLADELNVFVQHDRWFTAARFRRAIGRRPEAVRFAAALSRLLRDERLSEFLVRAAGRVCGTRSARFARTVKAVAQDIDDGKSLSESLRRHPRYFDAAFCRFLVPAESREDLRARLDRIARAGEVG